MISVQFIGPVIILVYCYGRIAWTLTRRIDSNLGTDTTTSELDNKVNIKFVKARTTRSKQSCGGNLLYNLLGK